jgi:seryl-tRNA synthetase
MFDMVNSYQTAEGFLPFAIFEALSTLHMHRIDMLSCFEAEFIERKTQAAAFQVEREELTTKVAELQAESSKLKTQVAELQAERDDLTQQVAKHQNAELEAKEAPRTAKRQREDGMLINTYEQLRKDQTKQLELLKQLQSLQTEQRKNW